MVNTDKPKRLRPSQERRFINMAIPPAWAGETCVLIASGPSLTQAQVNTAKVAWIDGQCKVMGCNDAYRIAPWMNALYAADEHWWDHHIEAVRQTNITLLFSQHELACKKYGLWMTPGRGTSPHGPGLSVNPEYIVFGFNSGFQAFNIAVLLGCKRLILIGYDCKEGPQGEKHWFGDHPGTMNRKPDWKSWATCYHSTVEILAEHGVEVINCSPGSVIDAFPRSTIGRVLGV